MNTFDAIKKRASYRGKYKNISVPRNDLEQIMLAGLMAPSGCNKQTTSLIGVDDKNVLKELMALMDPPIAQTAPAVICVLTERIIAYRDKCYSTQDYSAAIENMLLATVSLGYDSCWYEGHITDEDKIGRKIGDLLGVPQDMELVCILPIGIADEEIKSVNKKPYSSRMSFNSFS